MKGIKEGTKKAEAVILLYNLGGLWKRDFVFALKWKLFKADTQGYRLYKDLLKDEIIVERTVEKVKGKRLASDSYTLVLLNINNSIVFNDKTRKIYKDRSRAFNSKSITKLYRALSESRIKVAMYTSSIYILNKEKPSLVDALKYNGVINDDIQNYNSNYIDYSYNEWQKNSYCNGYYYSSSEIREALSLINKSKDDLASSIDTDIMMQSRIKGVIIKGAVLYFVYIANPGENKLIKINNEGEQKFINITVAYLKKICGTGVLLPIAKAIIISDRDSEVYTAVTGNPAGRIKKDDLLEKQEVIIKNYKQYHKGKTPKFSWLNSNTSYFEQIYVIPFNICGMISLIMLPNEEGDKALVNSTINKLATDENYKKNDINSKDRINRIGYYKGTDLIYIPMFEIKYLARIRNYFKEQRSNPYSIGEAPLSIITEVDMVNAISHSICGPAYYYFFEDDELYQISEDYYQEYDYNGYSKGMNIAKSYIESNGYIATNKVLNSLPKKAGYNNINVFWNEIANGSEEFMEYINFDELKRSDVVVKRIRKKKKTIYVKETTLSEISKKAKEKGITANRYIAELIYKDLHSVENTPRKEE